MFDKLSTKLRHKQRFQKQENGRPSAGGTPAYSFDNCSVASSPRSSIYSSEASGKPFLAPNGRASSYGDFPPYNLSSPPRNWISSNSASPPPGHWISSNSASPPPSNWTSSKEGSSDEVEDIQYLPGYEDAEEKFLENFEDYFEHLHVDNIRKEQYPKLELQRLTYLDYANSALFSRFQVQQHMQVLLEEGPNLGVVSLANAQSSNMTPYVLDTLQRLLRLFNVSSSDYAVVFTTGFAAGYRLFSEIYPFRKRSTIMALIDNHESIRHVIASSEQQGGRCVVVPLKGSDLHISASELRALLRRQGARAEGGGLLVYPAQSNLSGMQHSLNWIPEVQQFGSHVLLDVSTHLPLGPLDLSIHQPEFVLGSFHHMLGYPSGLGFLLVRKKVFSVHKDSHSIKLKSGLEEGNDCHIVCEDNNINLLSFAALSFGLQHLKSLGIIAIRSRVHSLMTWLNHTLKLLKHKDNGAALIQIYGSMSAKMRGNIVAFNVVDSTGNCVPASLIQKLAGRSNIIIGAGYFCNPGLATLLRTGMGNVADASVFRSPAVPFSTLRVSLGAVSNFHDVYRLVQFLCRFRDEDQLSYEALDFLEDYT